MSTTYLTQALHRAARQYPGRVATICGDRRRTYGEFVERIARLAAGLLQLGVSPGDRVGMLSLNSDRFLEFYYGTWWAGGAVNPINIRWSVEEIAYSLDDCDTRVLLVDDAFAPLIPKIMDRSKSVRTVVYTGDGERPGGMFSYEQLIGENPPVPDAVRRNDDVAGVFYTGGTTGFPKGVTLSHTNLVGSALGIVDSFVLEGDIGLHAAPMFHLADGTFIFTLTMRGCTHVIVPSFNAERVIEEVHNERVTNLLLVPTMIQMLVDHPRLADYGLDSVRLITYGASPISEALLDRAMQRLPKVKFQQAYGLTELSPVVTLLGPEFHSVEGRCAGKLRSAGRPAITVEVKIVDANGREVPSGTVGEIAIRGPGVMQGYWNNPIATRAVLKDGWMHTGDGACMDEEGFVYIVDRLKDMIVSGGENVYSAEVENAISQHPAVAACAVIGIPDTRWGEAVHAVLVCKPGVRQVSFEDIKAHCRLLIANYKCPRSIEIRDALPLSGAGKVLKSVLREPYWQDQKRRVG